MFATAENIALALTNIDIFELADDDIRVIDGVSECKYSISIDKALVSLSLPTNLIFRFILETYRKQFSKNEKFALKAIFRAIKPNQKDIPSAKIKAICK